MKRSLHESGKVAVGVIIVVVLIVLIGGLGWTYSSRRAAGLRDTLRLVKDTSQDAATTTKVKTALLLSKHVSAFDTAVATARGEVTLTGEVPTEEVKGLAAAIARDTSGVGAVHNNLTVNPGVGANPEAAASPTASRTSRSRPSSPITSPRRPSCRTSASRCRSASGASRWMGRWIRRPSGARPTGSPSWCPACWSSRAISP